jgi:hypothetical protein
MRARISKLASHAAVEWTEGRYRTASLSSARVYGVHRRPPGALLTTLGWTIGPQTASPLDNPVRCRERGADGHKLDDRADDALPLDGHRRGWEGCSIASR